MSAGGSHGDVKEVERNDQGPRCAGVRSMEAALPVPMRAAAGARPRRRAHGDVRWFGLLPVKVPPPLPPCSLKSCVFSAIEQYFSLKTNRSTLPSAMSH